MALVEHAMIQPSVARGLEENSHEREYARYSLRRLWHKLYDPCPTLLETLGSRDNQTFNEFLEFGNEASLPLDWTLHCAFFLWYSESVGFSSQAESIACGDEAMAASAWNWLISDRTVRKAILICNPSECLASVQGLKVASALERPKVARVQFDYGMKEKGFVAAFSADDDHRIWSQWEVIA